MRSRTRHSYSPRPNPAWALLPEDKLLRLKLSDLELAIGGSALEKLLKRAHADLARRGIRFRPHYWLSSEWFTPDGIPGVALPFYLVHERLQQLEKRQMRGLELESPQLCLKILRHEIGHAIENAFALRRLEGVQRVFGRSDANYPRTYAPQPYSRKFVRNLGDGYAQSHPDEDFAETFAVWLTGKRAWRRKYRHWKALEKLEFMDELMHQHVIGKKPVLVNRRVYEPLAQLNTTLQKHYQLQRKRFGLAGSPEFDRSLRRLFRSHHAPRVGMTAHSFLRKIRRDLSRDVATQSGEPMYVVNRVVTEMIHRAQALNLHLGPSRTVSTRAYRSVLPMLTTHVVRFIRAGHHRIAI
jgi:hypothetical protein